MNFTLDELIWIEVACHLRAEACEKNGDEDKEDAATWRKIAFKISAAIALANGDDQ